MRPLVVRRLLALTEAGGVTRAHVAVAAEAVGVSERTVWRWLAAARASSRADPPGRHRFTLDDALWACLADLGGNVKALHRRMCAGADKDTEGETPSQPPRVVSLTTLYHAVRRDLRSGRVLGIARPIHGSAADGYDRALADLALPGTVDEQGRPTPPIRDAEAVRGSDPIAGPEPVDDGVRLYTPGAHLVSTRQLGQVAEALTHTVAARGIACVYGDTGHGKTVAVHQALRLLPRRVPVHRAQVAVKPALPQVRAALLTAFGLPAAHLTNRTDAADRVLIDALKEPGVLIVDDVQRIAAPELDYLRLLVDAPTTRTSLVLCGAGAERTLARAPALASRVLTWQQVPRLDAPQVPGVLRLFHPLWDAVADEDVAHADQTCARGNFRAWAKITSHLYAVRHRDSGKNVDRALLAWACSRLGPPL
ncbi:ATP-binding protein [Streptomyces sp. SID3343]|uniref:ATP-binding protein n=1 Tax=Streptomyces sp. SID3343 TaxID=2690260 RepID=UPI00136F6C56|nr:ATP-binding protein [Streptomyces sp. SID3343]